MLTFEKFTGINNVLPSERLGASDLTVAMNVDVGLSGELRRRGGYSLESEDCHKNLWHTDGYMLATVLSDLYATPATGPRRLLVPDIWMTRMWYCDLPDGRVAYSNGLVHGITDGFAAYAWGVPLPDSGGVAQAVTGALDAGTYSYLLSHVRQADGLEGGAVWGGQVQVSADGGVLVQGLPQRDGFSINVYLSGANGDQCFLAGSAPGHAFSYLGKTADLILPCRTEGMAPAPVGTVSAVWRSRALVAQDNVLWASRPGQVELFDFRKDFKQFSAPITLVHPAIDGIWVGTEDELVFLAGDTFDTLTFRQVLDAPVVLGSCVSVPGEFIKRGDGAGQLPAMVCIAGGGIVAGFVGGSILLMTSNTYRADVREVAATFRVDGGVPQYIAIPQ